MMSVNLYELGVEQGKRSFLQKMTVICLMTLLSVSVTSRGDSQTVAPALAMSPRHNVASNTPYPVVTGGVTDFVLRASENKIFWRTKPGCQPTRLAVANDTDEIVSRIPSNGGPTRQLYFNQVSHVCNQQGLQIGSPITADADYVYWVGPTGVMRLSTNANVGDAPQLLAAGISGGEIIQNETHLFVAGPTAIWRIQKSSGAAGPLVNEAGHDLSLDFKYLYWLNSVNALRSVDLATSQTATLDTGVNNYYAEGRRCITLTICWHFVYMSKGDRVDRYDQDTKQITPNLYVAAESTMIIHDMTSSLFQLFFFESRVIPGPGIQPRVDHLIRANRDGTNPETIYTYPNGLFTGFQGRNLTNDFVHLYWHGGGDLLRLPTNVDALPSVNMKVTDLQITQAVQNDNNTVPLIKDRRTFVVAGVQAEGTAISGVSARLIGNWNGGAQEGVLSPVNTIGTHITVQPAPDKGNIDHHFIFELPWLWTRQSDLRLRVELDPYQTKIEPNYADNHMEIGPFNFLDSPRMEVIFVAFGHQIGSKVYYPRLKDDVVKAYSWLRRTLPLASTPGFADDPTPGFRPNLWFQFDEGLGSRVDQSHASCKDSGCAPAYTNSVMGSWRSDPLYDIDSTDFLYGMITNASGDWVAGAASPFVARVSSGAVGPNISFGDSLAAHEISHSMGRSHPFKGSSKDVKPACKNTNTPANGALDTVFPYEDQLIGPKDDSIRGFNAGDAEFAITQALLPSSRWGDYMGYCAPDGRAWVSDYTYECVYKDLMGHNAPGNFLYTCFGASSAAAKPVIITNATSGATSYLSVAGLILPESNLADLTRVRILADFAELPPSLPGNDYSLKLLDDSNNVLASHPFTPVAEGDETGYLGFQLLVELAANTRQLRVVREGDGAVIATRAISANAPVVSNVTLVNPPSPVSGEIKLQWQASDADGDTLRYDVLYTPDGGQAAQPLFLNLSDASVSIDTTLLGGGSTAVFRVVAHDGAHATAADTAPFVMDTKAPTVSILEPSDQRIVAWGQLVNFIGSVQDLQGRPVSLSWRNEAGTLLGTESLLSLDNLPVGANIITLRVTAGRQIAEATVTVIVADDFTLPGPTLSVSPASVAWAVGPASSATQTATIYVSNIGTGNLDWTASSDADWLSLDQTSGTAPASITLTADASDMGNAETRRADLIIQTTSGTAQTFTIPVILSNQNIMQAPSNLFPYGIYLPVIQKLPAGRFAVSTD